jgi:hypothetical protein
MGRSFSEAMEEDVRDDAPAAGVSFEKAGMGLAQHLRRAGGLERQTACPLESPFMFRS